MPFILEGKEYTTLEEMLASWRRIRTRTLRGRLYYNWYLPVARPVIAFYWFVREQIPEFLKRVWEYLPILWKDRDFDYTYMLRMLQFKLSRMRKDIEESRIHTRWQKDARRIRYAELLLERLLGFNTELDDKKRKDISARLWRHIDKYYIYWWN